MRSSMTADRAAVVPEIADSRRNSALAAGSTRRDSWAVCPNEMSAGPLRAFCPWSRTRTRYSFSRSRRKVNGIYLRYI